MNLIEKIFKLMKENNITAAQLTKEANLSVGLVTQWKQGKQTPSAKTLQKIADYFNLPLSYFYTDDEEPTPSATPNPSTAKIVEKMAARGITRERLAKLDEKQTEDLLNIIEIFLKNIK